MIDRKHIESILQANGITPTANDEEIRSVLVSAKWSENEVDTALSVLKENTQNFETHIDTLHKIFRTDESLSSHEISNLLGIDVDLPSREHRAENSDDNPLLSQHSVIMVVAIMVAFVSLGYVMYSQKIGPFHEMPAEYITQPNN